mgnify:CR=1 FL=1
MTTGTSSINLTYRPANDRGLTDIDWLYSRHSFSFGNYFDPANTHYSVLRVINDDIIAPGMGFGEHPHRDMEIVTWMIDGSLKHGDSLGNLMELRPGELQAMSAGSGIRHSEFNASTDKPAHLLQIWLMPAERGISPRYDQRTFDAANRAGRWDTLAAGPRQLEQYPTAMPIYQDAMIRVVDLKAGQSVDVSLDAGRKGYLHLATGKAAAASQQMNAGDAVTFDGGGTFTLTSEADGTQALLFDLP